jgi:hypothetical protein
LVSDLGVGTCLHPVQVCVNGVNTAVPGESHPSAAQTQGSQASSTGKTNKQKMDQFALTHKARTTRVLAHIRAKIGETDIHNVRFKPLLTFVWSGQKVCCMRKILNAPRFPGLIWASSACEIKSCGKEYHLTSTGRKCLMGTSRK